MGIIHAGVEDVDLGMLSQGRRMASRARETDGNPSHVSSGGGMYVFFGGLPSGQLPAYLRSWPWVASSVSTDRKRSIPLPLLVLVGLPAEMPRLDFS